MGTIRVKGNHPSKTKKEEEKKEQWEHMEPPQRRGSRPAFSFPPHTIAHKGFLLGKKPGGLPPPGAGVLLAPQATMRFPQSCVSVSARDAPHQIKVKTKQHKIQ